MSKKPFMVIWWPQQHNQDLEEQQGMVPNVQYRVYSPQLKVLSEGHAPLNELPQDNTCLVLIHPSEVSLFAVNPPKVSGRKLRDALVFLVEPYLLNDPEDNCLEYWPELIDDPSQAIVSVVSKSRLREIASLCTEHQLKLLGLSCELLQPQENPTLWISNGMLLASDPVSAPGAIDLNQPNLIEPLLVKRLQAMENSALPYKSFSISQDDSETLGHWLRNVPVTPQEGLLADPGLLHKRQVCSPATLKSFGLQVQNVNGLSFKPLYRAFGLFVALSVVCLNLLALKANQNEQSLKNQLQAAFSKALPNTPMVADPLILIARAKKDMARGTQKTNVDGVSYFLHQLALGLKALPFNSLSSLDYQENTLRITFSQTVTKKLQNQATKGLKNNRQYDIKWLAATQNSGPILVAKRKSR